MLMLLCSTASGLVPYDSYFYNYWESVVSAPQAYVLNSVITGSDLGVGAFSNPQDIFIDSNHHLYILDSGNNRIIHCNEDLNIVEIITEFYNESRIDRFNNPQNIFVTEDGKKYVSDTGNGRVIILDTNSKLIGEIDFPISESEGIFPPGFRFRPISVIQDRAQRVIVVSEGQSEGLMELDPDGTFRGFFGAPRVNPTIADIFWYRLATEEQRGRLALFIPTEFNSISLDSTGFLYATIATGEDQSYRRTPIRRLNPSGSDVMRRLGFVPPCGDITGLSSPSRFIDVAPRENGIYSALDAERGRIFTYDSDGHLLYVFGGLGEQRGTFRRPVAISSVDQYLLVLDARMNSINIFEPTEYAQTIHSALDAYALGMYDLSTDMWQDVLKMNANYDRAYTGIGRAYLVSRNLQEAMHYLKLGNNREDYSKAFGFYRRDKLGEHFGKIMTGIFLGIILLTVFSKYRKSKQDMQKTKAITIDEPGESFRFLTIFHETNSALKYSLYLILHPFDGFWDLKHEKRGNFLAAVIILVITLLSYIFIRQYTGFIFNIRDLSKLNIYREAASVLIPFILWVVINWGITTLMEGKGTLKDVFIASAYALVPLVFLNVPATIISNYITLEEGYYYYLMLSTAIGWTALLLVIGTQVTHEYSMVKTLYTALLTVIGMLIVIFIGIFFFALIDQLISFGVEINKELSLRM